MKKTFIFKRPEVLAGRELYKYIAPAQSEDQKLEYEILSHLTSTAQDLLASHAFQNVQSDCMLDRPTQAERSEMEVF